MFSRFARFLALAFTAAAIPTSAAHAMPTEPVVTGSVTKGTVVRSDAAQLQATKPVASLDRSDAAQISQADHVVLRGRLAVPSVPAPSHVTAPSDASDWAFTGAAALIVLTVAGAAVALRPQRVTI